MFNRLLLCVEVDVHVGQRIAGRRPTHQRIFPALAVVEFHSPSLEVVSAALHGVLWRNKDADASLLHMLFGHAID